MERIMLFIKENIRLLIGAGVVILVAIFLITLAISKKSAKAIVNGQAFQITVARTDKEKQIGLSSRNNLSQNQGMLFNFGNPDYYRFWMKDMKFSIDIIYIKGNKVTTVIKNAKAPTSSSDVLAVYTPDEKSDKVLEINAGLSDKYGIKKGSTVEIQNL